MPSDPFNRRALYSMSGKAEQERARRQWKDLELVKVIDAVRKAKGRSLGSITPGQGKEPTARLTYALREFERGGTGAALKTLQGVEFAGLVNDVIRYGRMDKFRGLIGKFLGSLGPVGKTIELISKAVDGPKKSSDPDIQAAKNVLQAFGYETLPPPSAKAPQNEKERAIEAAKKLLEQEGYIFTRDGKEVKEPDLPPIPVAPPREKKQRERTTVDVEVAGQKRRFPLSHPIVTREKIPTPESSNVQWFSYDVESWTLYIRYQYPSSAAQGHLPTHRDGPLYGYSNVPPEIFLKMMAAGSKGGFVWSHIRNRGTVSGHKYDYRLVAVTGGYVPRKATLRADGEWFEERQIRTINRAGQIKIQKSKAAMPAPSRFTRFPGGQPDRGGPNRGNQGKPNRGR